MSKNIFIFDFHKINLWLIEIWFFFDQNFGFFQIFDRMIMIQKKWHEFFFSLILVHDKLSCVCIIQFYCCCCLADKVGLIIIFFFWNRYLQSIVVDLLIDYPWLLLISHTSFVWVLKNWNYRLCLFWLNLYKQIVSWLIFDHLFSYFRFYFFQIDKKNFNGTIKWKLVILWSKQQRSNVSRKCISCTFFSHL